MDVFVGTIMAWAPNFAPYQWAYCQGQTLAVSTNQVLFALIGTTYGGNGTTNFQLPNLAGRVAIGAGTGIGLSPYVLGQVGGAQSINLSLAQLPTHTHVASVTGISLSSITIQASNADATDHAPSSTANSIAAPYDVNNVNPIAGFNNSAPNTPLNVAASATVGGGSVTVATAGSSQPVSLLQPYLAINYIIALQGIYPPRN